MIAEQKRTEKMYANTQKKIKTGRMNMGQE
jgi:hypothetical protein